MENRAAGTSLLDKKKSSPNTDFLTSMKLQNSTHLFPSRINLDCPFDDGGGGGANDVSSSSVCVGGGGGGVIFGRSTNLQPYDIYPASYSAMPYKSAGGEMSFPFTAAQWKELERQAMIYKCMISSVPVPTHLLLPLSTNFSATPLVDSSVPLYSGRYSRNGDPEPGRCKRTDGKKWRCAREVAPHQKYCERHLHRGRPRSRKPVEPKNAAAAAAENHKKSRLENTKSLPPSNESLNTKTDLGISSPYYKATNNRNLGVTTTEGEIVSSEPPWENMMEASMGLENCYFPQPYVEQIEPLNLFSYPNFTAPEIDHLPSGFIDAWSIDNRNNEPSISLNDGDLSPSLNLSMAMAAGNSIVDREMSSIQTGEDRDDGKRKDSVWASGVSWEPFARGGPLAEALQPVGGSNPASPYNSMSTPATTVSSPSGVLHWTLFSHSDSSVCNSPTFVAPPAEGSNQWHN